MINARTTCAPQTSPGQGACRESNPERKELGTVVQAMLALKNGEGGNLVNGAAVPQSAYRNGTGSAASGLICL